MKKTLIITEPLKSEQVVFSQKIADEALQRGWQVWECAKEDLLLENGKIFANIISYPDEEKKRVELTTEFDCIHFRPHPPIDIGYITALQILKLIEDEVEIYNKPSAILKALFVEVFNNAEVFVAEDMLAAVYAASFNKESIVSSCSV